MKKRHIIIFVLTFLFLLACDPNYLNNAGLFRAYKNQRPDLIALGLYSCPGMKRKDVGLKEQDIQRDKYGREYCIFQHIEGYFYSNLPKYARNTSAILVMQSCIDDKILFYEDYCFRIFPKGGLSEEELAVILEINDWNKPFHEEKCSTRVYSELGRVYSERQTKRIYSFKEAIVDHYFPDYFNWGQLLEDKVGNELYWIVEREGQGDFRKKEAEWIKEHPFLYDAGLDGVVLQIMWDMKVKGNPCTSWLVIRPADREFVFEKDVLRVDNMDFGPALHGFKIAHDWVFE